MTVVGITSSSVTHPYWMSSLSGTFYGYRLGLDSSGNIYSGLSSANGAFCKFDSSGVPQWHVTSGINTQHNNGMTFDSSGNTYVAGYLSTNNTSYVMKFNSSGVLQWQRALSPVGNLTLKITVDSSGNIYAVCSNGNILKYNSSGVLQWNKVLGSGIATLYAATTDSSGNLYVAGQSQPSTNVDILFAKYDSAGTLLWQTALSTASTTIKNIIDLATDSSGNVYGSAYFTHSGLTYPYLFKLNTSGVLQWQRYFALASTAPFSLNIDSSDNIYWSLVGGILNKYNSSGVLQWQRTFAGTTTGSLNDIAFLSSTEYIASFFASTSGLAKLPTDGSLAGTANRYVNGGNTYYYIGSTADSASTAATTGTSSLTSATGTMTDSAGALTQGTATAYTNVIRKI